jgi:hypothetical protein
MVVTRKLIGKLYWSQKLIDRMSDPGTTYRSRDEVQQVRSERDAIAGLKKYILEWGATDEASLKAVTEAKESPQPDIKDFWTDIYVSHLRSILEYEADEISTRVPSHRSCVDERRRRFTTTRHWNDVEVYLFFFHASGSLDDVQSSEMLKRQHTGLLQRMLHPLTDRRSTWPWLCAVTFGHESGKRKYDGRISLAGAGLDGAGHMGSFDE